MATPSGYFSPVLDSVDVDTPTLAGFDSKYVFSVWPSVSLTKMVSPAAWAMNSAYASMVSIIIVSNASWQYCMYWVNASSAWARLASGPDAPLPSR